MVLFSEFQLLPVFIKIRVDYNVPMKGDQITNNQRF